MPPWEGDSDNDLTITVELNAEEMAEELLEEMAENNYTSESDNRYDYSWTSGDSIEFSSYTTNPLKLPDQDMRYSTQESWALDTLLQLTDAEYVGRAWTGNENEHDGYIGVAHEAVEKGADEVLNEINAAPDDESSAVIFNEITSEWPWNMRTALAGFIAARDADEYADNFVDDLIGFAEDNDIPIDTDRALLDTIDTSQPDGEGDVYADDPMEDDDLTRDEAVFILGARLHGLNDSDIDFNAIDDVETMLSTLLTTGDYEYAIRAQYYSTDVPRFAVSNRDRPSEWEEVDRDNAIEGEPCEMCNSTMYEGEYNDEVVTVIEGGEIQPGRVIDLHDTRNPFGSTATPNGYICPSCASGLEDGADVNIATYVDEEGNVSTIHWIGNIFLDVGKRADDERVSFARGVLTPLLGGGRMPFDDEVIPPDPSHSDVTRQEADIREAARGNFPQRGEHGPILFEDSGRHCVIIDLNTHASVAWGKAVIDGRNPLETI